MKVAVLRFPGTNCEFDTQYAFEKLGHTTELVWHEDEKLDKDRFRQGLGGLTEAYRQVLDRIKNR